MKVDENLFFREATMRVCGSLDIVAGLEDCLRYFEAILPIRELSIQLYEADYGMMRCIAFVSRLGKKDIDVILPNRLWPIPKQARTFLDKYLETAGKVITINFSGLDLVTREWDKLLGKTEGSYLVVRLEIEGNQLGFLLAGAEGVTQFSEDQAKLLGMLQKPFAIAVANTLRYREVIKLKENLQDDNQYLNRELLRLSGDEIIGSNFGLKGVMKMVQQVAPMESPVLLLGETGAGKEVIANAIHYSSLRKDGPFIKVNCGAIPETLIDSELFGHEKGAFTGALSQKRGRFERAHGGTIFLDEIGELPLQVQVRLLRVLQQKEIERVGGTSSVPVNVRIISATHRDLQEMLLSGEFREDLWFRLNVFPIMIPPLRQRKEDIPALLQHFLERKVKEMKLSAIPPLAPGAVEQLEAYHWPGNVRELENAIERALIKNTGVDRGGELRFDEFSGAPRQKDALEPEWENQELLSLDEAISLQIRRALQLTKGKIYGSGGAAERLGLNPNTLRSKMKRLGIPFDLHRPMGSSS